MLDTFFSFAGTLNAIVWSDAMIILCLLVGLIYTIALKGFQFTKIGEMVSLLRGKNREKSTEGLSAFQSFCLSVGTRVGTGNILGVTTAVATGGPGAVFWMWVLAILGAATSFGEHVMSQIYKIRVDGMYRGGGAFYLRGGIGGPVGAVLGTLFAIFSFINTGIIGCLQPEACADALEQTFGIPPIAGAIIIIVLLGLVIWGGIKSIGTAVEYIVPIMSVLYLLIALIICLMNITAIPGMIGMIFSSAFGTNAMFGGILGTAINMGVKRGVFSSEAGQGTSTHHGATADVSHPAKQGMVQALSVYVDTILVCSATAFMLLLSGCYNVYDGAGNAIYEGMPGIEAGIAYTQAAANSVLPGIGKVFMGVALFVFAFTTLIGQYNVAESNLAMLYKGYSNNKTAHIVFKVWYMVPILAGCLMSADTVWNLSDVGNGINAWIILLTLIYFIPVCRKVMADYFDQLKEGRDPVFRPSKLGIKNAELWEEIADEYEAKAAK